MVPYHSFVSTQLPNVEIHKGLLKLDVWGVRP